MSRLACLRLQAWERLVAVSLIALLLVALRPMVGRSAVRPPAIRASAIALIDGRTGQVLYSQNPRLRWPPASTTKILTALLVVESLSEEKIVTISPRAARARTGRAIGLEVGEQWRVGDLLRVMLLYSANDAAVALAEAVAGSVEAFADLMNAKAASLGARDSHFVVPHGLEDPSHYSTAYDLALIAHAALQHQQIAEIVRLRTWELTRPGQRPRMVINSNRLLWRYPYADGVKTGWVPESGHCLVASATRDGRKLIAVVLHDERPFTDAQALLNYGFTHFTLTKVAEAGQVLATIPLPNGSTPLVATVPNDVFAEVPLGADISHTVVLAGETVPIRGEAVVGRIIYTSDGEVVASAALVAGQSVPPASLWIRLLSWATRIFGSWS